MTDVPSENSLDHKPASESKERKASKHEEKPAFQAIDLAPLIQAIKDEGAAARNEEQREDAGKIIRDWITIGLIFCTLCAVGWQVYEMIHVYGPIHDQAVASGQQAAEAKRAADATIKAADATVKAAEAATKQSEIATKQAESSDRAAIQAQRAWIGPKDAKLESKPTAGQKNKITVEYQNTGKEPALGFVFDSNLFVATAEEESSGVAGNKMMGYMQKCVSTPPRPLAGVIFPTSGFTSASLSSEVTETLIDEALVEGTKSLIVQGCFGYLTGNIPHHSAFCFFYNAKLTDIAHLNICISGNHAD